MVNVQGGARPTSPQPSTTDTGSMDTAKASDLLIPRVYRDREHYVMDLLVGDTPASSSWALRPQVIRILQGHQQAHQHAHRGLWMALRQCNLTPTTASTPADRPSHRTADRLKSSPAWWAGCRWFYH